MLTCSALTQPRSFLSRIRWATSLHLARSMTLEYWPIHWIRSLGVTRTKQSPLLTEDATGCTNRVWTWRRPSVPEKKKWLKNPSTRKRKKHATLPDNLVTVNRIIFDDGFIAYCEFDPYFIDNRLPTLPFSLNNLLFVQKKIIVIIIWWLAWHSLMFPYSLQQSSAII